ncbi:hypothetical protein Tco_1388880 [Tanacetum coccineum]
MSPRLFTLVMEILTLLMMKNVKGNSKFKYHRDCKEVKLTKVMEMWILVKDADKIKILDILPFAVGKLPMKYLGLIASVLASLNVYWACVFLIPKTVVKEIDKALKGFLWCKDEIKKGKAKVKWESVCTPKSQGGLGIRMFGKWNEILLMKNLWNIAEEKNTLWVKWVKMVKLRGESIWEVQKGANDSWTWKYLLELRSKIRKHTFKVLGDGKNTNFWVIQWNSEGILSEIIN